MAQLSEDKKRLKLVGELIVVHTSNLTALSEDNPEWAKTQQVKSELEAERKGLFKRKGF